MAWIATEGLEDPGHGCAPMMVLRSADTPDVGLTATEELKAPTGCGALVSATAASMSSVELAGSPSWSGSRVEWPVMGSTCAGTGSPELPRTRNVRDGLDSCRNSVIVPGAQ